MNQPWLNTQTYSPLMLTLFLTGCALWVVVYVVVLRSIKRDKFVEIPIIGVAGNISWEFIWSFVYQPDMGKLVLIGYAAWFFLDCFIVYSLLKYGYKQLNNPSLKSHSKAMILVLIAAWSIIIIGLNASHYDTPIGTISAYWDNVIFSGAYCILILTTTTPQYFSVLSGWCKGLGTGIISIAVCIQWPDNIFLVGICSITAIFDAIYLWFLYQRKREGKS